MILAKSREELAELYGDAVEKLQKEVTRLQEENEYLKNGHVDITLYEHDGCKQGYEQASAEAARLARSNRALKSSLRQMTEEKIRLQEQVKGLTRKAQTLEEYLLGSPADLDHTEAIIENLERENASLLETIDEMAKESRTQPRASAPIEKQEDERPVEVSRSKVILRASMGEITLEAGGAKKDTPRGASFEETLLGALRLLKKPCEITVSLGVRLEIEESDKVGKALAEGNHVVV